MYTFKIEREFEKCCFVCLLVFFVFFLQSGRGQLKPSRDFNTKQHLNLWNKNVSYTCKRLLSGPDISFGSSYVYVTCNVRYIVKRVLLRH